MEYDNAEALIRNAEVLITAAENEQQRAQEDVITHLICANSRQSIYNYLSAFLLRKHIGIEDPTTLSSLLKQCKLVDARFESLDLIHVHCRFKDEDEDYCLDAHQVDKCLQTAQLARSIVTHNSPPY